MQAPVKVELFIAPGCPHCPNVLRALAELIKAGKIAELEVSNMAMLPEKARALNIRSVPWVKIGPFELTGAQTKGELLDWIHRVQSESGMQEYFSELLTSGELQKVINLVKKQPDLLSHFPDMIQDKDTPLGAKIGIGAVFEELQGDTLDLTIEQGVQIMKIIDEFEDDDDVQSVYHNVNVSDELAEAME